MTIDERKGEIPRPRKSMRGALAFWLSCAALISAACDQHHRLDNVTAVGLTNPEVRHPIGFSSRGESLDVEVPPGTEGLSPNQHIDIYRFLDRYRREATGRLVITVPAQARDRASIANSLQNIQRHVTDAEINYRIVQGGRQGAQRTATPSIALFYQRAVAVGPTCDHWSENVGRNEERIPYPNFGCATQRNLAVMVDNGRDLRQPQGEDPRAGERRSVSWSGYVSPAGGKSAGDGAADAGKKDAGQAAKK